MDYRFSSHALEMLKERSIKEAWVLETLENPHWHNEGADGNLHYFRSIAGNADRVLHVVLNQQVSPKRVVTVFFDRKARRRI